jgi:hypothetical protein
VNDPWSVSTGICDPAEVCVPVLLEGYGVYQPGTGSLTSNLEKISFRPVSVTMSTFRVERNRTVAGSQGVETEIERLGGVN